MFLDKFSTSEEINNFKEKNEKTFFKSRFNFLNEVGGLRPSCITGFLGTSGSGKTTLFKSVIADTSAKTKVIVYTTEETPIEYQLGLKNAGAIEKNIEFLSEKKLLTGMDFNMAKIYIAELVISSGAKVLFIDNLTTSRIYENLNVRGQGEFIDFLSKLAEENDIAIAYLLHTRKDITDNMGKQIEGEDVRGSNQAFQKAQYYFILQNIAVNNQLFAIIRIRKHRFHMVDSRYFLLHFKNSVYTSDVAVDFSKIAEIFKSRNRIKG